MRQHLLDLFEIQKLDLNIREQLRIRDELPTGLREAEAALVTLEGQAKQLTDERATAEREARSLGILLDEEREKIRKWESRLGDLRNQREYQALHRETEGQRRANRDHEEKLQQSYRTQETLDEQLKALQERIEQARATCDGRRAEVEGELTHLTEAIDTQQQRRDALVPSIPKGLFRKYDTIRSRRAGVGLSQVRDGSCVSCHMRLPPQLYNVLQRADTVEQCPSCHRVVFWEALLGEEAGGSPPAAKVEPTKAKPARKKASPRGKAKAASHETSDDDTSDDAPGASAP